MMNYKGLGFDFFIGCLIVSLLFWVFFDFGLLWKIMAVFLAIQGIIFLFSYKLKNISTIGKGVYWFSQNMVSPKTKFNHILISIFSIFFSIVCFIKKFNKADEKVIFDNLSKDTEFWIILGIIIIVNILIALIMVRENRRKSQNSF